MLFNIVVANKDKAAEYECEKRSFYSMLGISYYLTKDEFKTLMKTLGGMLCEGAGKQMKTVYASVEMKDLLNECGFMVKECLGAVKMTEQYFDEYNNNNPEHPMIAPEGVSYIFAVKQSL